MTLRCSAGSLVLRRSPTSPERSCPPFGLRPSRTGLDLSTKTSRRYPGSRACCFSACAGSWTTLDRSIHSRLTWLSCCLPPYRNGVGILIHRFSKLNSPAHQYPCLRFNRHLTMPPARLEARMGSLLSFPVGLFHPLQHAGLARRTPGYRLFVQVNQMRKKRPASIEPLFVLCIRDRLPAHQHLADCDRHEARHGDFN